MTKVFIGGSRQIVHLHDDIKKRLDNIVRKQLGIFVGDANGADKAVQKYLSDTKYKNVLVYCTGGNCRNNIGKLEIVGVETAKNKKDFSYYSA